MVLPRLITLMLAIATASADESWHTMRLGFNVGYITDTNYYHAALARTAADGFEHQRVMGAFLHGLRPAPIATADWVSWVLGNHTQTLTLTLSDFPYPIPADLLAYPAKYLSVWPGEPGTAKLASEVVYTNRGPVAAWANNGSLMLLSTYLTINHRIWAKASVKV